MSYTDEGVLVQVVLDRAGIGQFRKYLTDPTEYKTSEDEDG